MKISRMTVDKLGVKLYDRVSAVLAELVANSYDADATEVQILAPMGEYLATKSEGHLIDSNFVIEVRDDGIGMTPEEVNEFYLRVGAERRNDPKRGDTSKRFKRRVMGRKGVGKLAPFGICQRLEVITAGGEEVSKKDEHGQDIKGYRTAHLILDKDDIMSDIDVDYPPVVGELDETLRPQTGTILRLTNFAYRRVPTLEEMNRQLAQRFGVRSADWKIRLVDITNDSTAAQDPQYVGAFDVPTMPSTVIYFDVEKDLNGNVKTPETHRAFNEDGNIRTDVEAGFTYEDQFYPITGWVGYARHNYKDDLMAGVRIYCRGKIAAQTSIFNLKSGFTGEYDIRSYVVGEIHADWLDEAEDLIQTDRRDILWSHELGRGFEVWGQSVVKKVGVKARDPMKKKTWDVFKEVSNIEQKITDAFPLQTQQPIRERAIEFAKLIGQTMREDEAQDPEHADSIVQLSLTFAPHLTLDQTLRAAADSKDSPLAVMTNILKTARVAELSSFGRIADERVRVIARIEELKDEPKTLEDVFQSLIEEAPWLIDPQWSPISANMSFSTLRTEFEKYYKIKTGNDLQLTSFTKTTKRADFVLSTQDNVIQIIEIKRPHHRFEDEEMERLNTYVQQMTNFLNEPNNGEFRKSFQKFHVTLVCDGERLTGLAKTAFEGLKQQGLLTYIGWTSFLASTRKMHEAFLIEAERQRKDVAKDI
jgi:hypothetical protein